MKEKRLEEEKNSINERRKDFNDHIISDFEEDKKKKNKSKEDSDSKNEENDVYIFNVDKGYSI